MLRCLMKQYGRVPWAYYIIVNMVHWKYLTGEKEEEKERQKEKQTKTGGDGEAEEKAHNASKIGTPEVSEDPLLSLSARHPLLPQHCHWTPESSCRHPHLSGVQVTRWQSPRHILQQ